MFLQSKPLVIMVVLFIACVVFAVVSDPLATFTGKKEQEGTRRKRERAGSCARKL